MGPMGLAVVSFEKWLPSECILCGALMCLVPTRAQAFKVGSRAGKACVPRRARTPIPAAELAAATAMSASAAAAAGAPPATIFFATGESP